jgi:hypothetical protein
MKLVVEEQDLDKAIEARTTLSGVSAVCIVTQAGKRQFGEDVVSSSSHSLGFKSGKYYEFADQMKASQLTNLFDTRRYNELRQLLPVILEIKFSFALPMVEKLRWLAAQIRGPLALQFNQEDPENCIVGLGERINEDGTLSKQLSQRFADKFEVTRLVETRLFYGSYGNLGIGVSHISMEDVTPEIAADVLERLADKYDREAK